MLLIAVQMALTELLFVADNLACFTYQQQDEPLYVMHELEVIVAVSGSHILDGFNQACSGCI